MACVNQDKDYGSEKGKLVMYGDNTWLKLFLNMFERADRTSSFFVSVSHKRTTVVYRRSVK